MHLSTLNWMRAEPLDVTLGRIRPLGYESIEISGEPERYRSAETRRLLAEYGIRCWGAVTLMLGERNLAARDQGQRERSVRYVRDVLTMASELGGEIVTLVPGTVGKLTPDATPDEEWRWMVDAMRECAAHARKVGVRIAIEPLNRFETYIFNRCEQALALADAVGPECGVCLDTYHLHMEEFDVGEAIRRAGDRLFNFHVADNNRFAAGLGTIDWPDIIGILKDIGYRGALANEFVAQIDRTPASRFPEMVDRNPAGLSTERMKSVRDHGSSVLSEAFYTGQMRITARTLLPLIGKTMPA